MNSCQWIEQENKGILNLQVHIIQRKIMIFSLFQSRCNLVLVPLISMAFISSHAAVPLSLAHLPYTDIQPMIAGPHTSISNNNNDGSLHVLQQHTDRRAVTHIRLQQYYLGFPVQGGYVFLHGKGSMKNFGSLQNSQVQLDGEIFQQLEADLGKPPSDFVKNSSRALEHFKSQFSQSKIEDTKVKPLIYIDSNQQAHWAYEISILIQFEQQIPQRPSAIVDAQTLQPYVTWDLIQRAFTPAKGKGFGGNFGIGIRQYGNDLPFLSILRDDSTSQCYMENQRVKVIDLKNSNINQAMQFNCPEEKLQSDGSYLTGYQKDGYDRVNDAFSPSNDALYSAEIVYNMYKEWLGVEPLEDKGDGSKVQPKKIIMRVHFGANYENAFWDAGQEHVTFGDGGHKFYPFVSLGLSAHEISHGFTSKNSNLAYYGESGGINESFSDMAAIAAEYYASNSTTWKFGWDIKKSSAGLSALRYMEHPDIDGMSIDNANQYYPNLDPHYSSGVYNRFFYLLATTPEWTIRKAFEVMATANMYYWGTNSTFDKAACGILSATRDYNYSEQDVKGALDQVGVNYSQCT